ncbi:MAG: hypothetical protein AB9844_09365 [Clostridiaceae bacterium]
MSENRIEIEIKIGKQAELNKRIKKETNRLKKLFCDMPADTMKKDISLIGNAAFMIYMSVIYKNLSFIGGIPCLMKNWLCHISKVILKP